MNQGSESESDYNKDTEGDSTGEKHTQLIRFAQVRVIKRQQIKQLREGE